MRIKESERVDGRERGSIRACDGLLDKKEKNAKKLKTWICMMDRKERRK